MEHIGTKSTLSVHKLYSKYSPLAWTHARCLPRHWSIVSSKIDCSRPHHIDEPPFQFIHYMDLSGRHDAAWQPRSRNPQDWDLGCLEATALPQESLALFDAAVQPLHVRGAVCRCTAGTKSLPDTLRIADSSMTSLWRREAAAKKSVRYTTRISCFVTMKLPHALQIYSTVFVKKCMQLHFSR